MAYVGILKSRFSEAATSSCVESGFDAHSTTSAPPSRNAIARFAVSLVTCRQAEARNPFSGCSFTKRLRMISMTGICCAAHSILRLPASASEISFTSPFFISAIAKVVLLECEILKFPMPKLKRWIRLDYVAAGEVLRSRAHFDAGAGVRTQARGLAQSGRAVRTLPGEARAAAPEVPIRRRRLINRPAQIQCLDNSLRRQRKILAHERGDALFRHALRAKRIDHHGNRLRHADSVSELHFRLARQAR